MIQGNDHELISVSALGVQNMNNTFSSQNLEKKKMFKKNLRKKLLFMTKKVKNIKN